MKKVMVFGTFDIFHPGHRNFLEQAKKQGDYLIVVVGRDATVEKVKGRKPKNEEKERMRIIQESGLAEEVVLGNLDDKYAVIEKHKPNVICLGYDQQFFVDGLIQRLKNLGLEKTEVIKLEAFKPEIYKSSKLK